MEDFWGEEKEPKKINKKKLIIVIIILLLLIVLIVLDCLYTNNKSFRDWTDKKIFRKEITEEDLISIDISEDENISAFALNNQIAILRKKKVELYDKFGSKTLELEVDINNPIFAKEDKYLSIAEENGKKVYLMNEKKILWENQVEGEISQIDVNKNGYVAVVATNTSYKSLIYLYDLYGNELFIIHLAKERVIDISISNNGEFLSIAEINTSGILIQSKIETYSIEKAQSDPNNSSINNYSANPGRMLSNIEYQGKERIVCVYDDGIDVLNGNESQNLCSFENGNVSYYSNELENNIMLIEEKAVGQYSANSYVTIKNILNLKEKEYITNQIAKDIYTYKNIIALNLGTELHIINTNGWLVKKYISDQEINNIIISQNIVGIIQREKIYIISI